MTADVNRVSSTAMQEQRTRTLGLLLERFARRVTAWAGGSWAFGLALAVIVVWTAGRESDPG